MFGSTKKNLKFITNDKRILDLTEMGLKPNDVIILNLKKSIFEILEDSQDIDLIKKSADSDKKVYVIVKENFPLEMGSIENLEDFKIKNKKIKKAFKKNNNVFFFFGNISDREKIYGIEDGTITMSDENFFDEFDAQRKKLIEKQLLEEEERKKEEERLLEERKNLEANELFEEEKKLNEINYLIDQDTGLIDSNLINSKINLENNLISNDEEQNVLKINDFDAEFDENNKKENSVLDYPMLDSNEYILKSIYDFIWRMLILNNNELLLNDLLYLSINNFPSLSSGQNEFIRDLSNKADSLFDIILKLDYKLEFNNKLFYIYLANLFTVINGFCKVNREFLFDISIWITDEARENFVVRTENYMNNSLISIQKIIYSHFIEFATLTQGSIPRIRGSLKYEDIHSILYKKIQNSKSRNLFCIIIRNLFRACHEIGLELDSIILNNENISNLDSKLKVDIANSYNILLEEIRNFIFLKGLDEDNISKLYNILMNIVIQNIIDERVQVTTIAELVNKEQVQIEDQYFKQINNNNSKNNIINIKYEEIEALYREAAEADKKRTINDQIYEFDLDSISDSLLDGRKSRFDKDYGINNELDLSSIKEFKEDKVMNNKIDSFETRIKANIKNMEEQRKLMQERISRYSQKSKDTSDVIKLK